MVDETLNDGATEETTTMENNGGDIDLIPIPDGDLLPEPEPKPEPEEKKGVTCDEIQDRIVELTSKKTNLEKGIAHITQVIANLPEQKFLKKAYKSMERERRKVDDEIFHLTSQFSICKKL